MWRDPEDVIAITAQFYSLPVSVLKGRRRTRKITEVRHMAMYLCCRYGSSFTDAGCVFARDHTTVLHGHRQTGYRLEREKQARLDFEALCNLIEDPTLKLAAVFPAELQPLVHQIVIDASARGRDAMAEHLSIHLGKLIGDLK